MDPFRPSAPLRVSAAGHGGRSRRSRRQSSMLLMALCLLLTGVVSPAPSRGADPVPPMSQEALVASLPRGEVFANDGHAYVWLPTLWATKEADGPSLSSAGDAPGAEGEGVALAGELLGRKGRFRIYGPVAEAVSPDPDVEPLEDPSADLPAYPVVLNERTKELGVLTRNLWLKLRDMGSAEAIAGEYGLVLSFSNPVMQTSFYRAPEGIDLEQLRERLLSDPRIRRVTLGIIGRVQGPR